MATGLIHSWDTWGTALDPTTIKAVFYEDKYFATHSAGSFTFERDEKVGGYYVTLSQQWDSAWVDNYSNDLHFTQDQTGDVYLWDDPDEPLLIGEWKSKVVVTQDYINLGAARVIADFSLTAVEAINIAAANAAATAANVVLWTDSQQLGTINGPTDYTDGAVIINYGGLNSWPINGDGQMENQVASGDGAVLFRLWVDKELKYSGYIASNGIFRLPTGYKSDTFEMGVSGAVRIRAIHVGETPFGLRKA